MRTKAGREMDACSQGCINAILTLPFKLLKLFFIIALWPIILPIWLIRRKRR